MRRAGFQGLCALDTPAIFTTKTRRLEGSLLGYVEDVPLLWKAKVANFDTYCGLDIQFLVSAGVCEILDYMIASGDEQDLEAAEYIKGG